MLKIKNSAVPPKIVKIILIFWRLSQVVKVTEHNFAKTPVATIPFFLHVENCSLFPTSLYYKADKDSVPSNNLAPRNSAANENGHAHNFMEEAFKILGTYYWTIKKITITDNKTLLKNNRS